MEFYDIWLVQAGKSSDAMELLSQTNICGYRPVAITIASLLSGCCQLGNLRIGETTCGPEHGPRATAQAPQF